MQIPLFPMRQIFNFCFVKNLNVPKPTGKLSIIATPIGNMSDLTPNIIKKLFQADLIGCEDRRVAGQLYTLIKNRNIKGKMQEQFGSLGLSSLILSSENQQQQEEAKNPEDSNHQFYNYSNMTDKERRKFLGKLSREEQKQFKIDYLKYKAKKIINKSEQFLYKNKQEKFDELYGIEVSDYKHIESQIMNTRAKKGRGVLIPLNTYSQTKMFDMVKNLLQSKHVAIVSDAGMPCISDPGWKMVRMIRETMPDVPIEVIGGPSAIDIMLTLASSTANSESLSGRFEGFASPQVSNMTEENMTYNQNLQLAKEKDFSIHFINSKKLKKNAYALQKIYGQDHKILLANELTKKFQRKFTGSLKQLTNHISNDEKQFEGIGQMSYLLYSDKGHESAQKQLKPEQISGNRIVSLNVVDFVKSLQNTELKSKEKAELLCSVFGMKGVKAKKLVYDNVHVKNKRKF